mmetsp:Transcript_37134/g.66864  ORF Transcript_37134/g.66864 Transcript_37134/m.66864 type:complete len:83 (-) Transcript_37134:528-776(-)
MMSHAPFHQPPGKFKCKSVCALRPFHCVHGGHARSQRCIRANKLCPKCQQVKLCDYRENAAPYNFDAHKKRYKWCSVKKATV